jgi:hypothetical protein
VPMRLLARFGVGADVMGANGFVQLPAELVRSEQVIPDLGAIPVQWRQFGPDGV